MSWRKGYVFKCGICGREKHVYRNGYSFLPPFWSGSNRKAGVCFCEKCREKFVLEHEKPQLEGDTE